MSKRPGREIDPGHDVFSVHPERSAIGAEGFEQIVVDDTDRVKSPLER